MNGGGAPLPQSRAPRSAPQEPPSPHGLPLTVADDRFVTFQSLANLMARHHLYVFFTMDPGPLMPYYDLFERLLAHRHYELAVHIVEECRVPPDMYLFGWFQTVFLKALPLATASRVWDVFLLDGVPHLYRTALALLDLLAPHLLGASRSFENTVSILTQSRMSAAVWEAISAPDVVARALDNVALPLDALLELEDLVGDPFFYRRVASRTAGVAAAAGPGNGGSGRRRGGGGGGGAGQRAGGSTMQSPDVLRSF
jgi:hypothetical protein